MTASASVSSKFSVGVRVSGRFCDSISALVSVSVRVLVGVTVSASVNVSMSVIVIVTASFS